MSEFKTGDKVICIDDSETDLKAFEVYTVKEVFQMGVSLDEIEPNPLFNGFASKRFVSFNLSKVGLYKAGIKDGYNMGWNDKVSGVEYNPLKSIKWKKN